MDSLFPFQTAVHLDFELICLFCCLSRLLDFCISGFCVCMAIIQNFARCHLLQFRWLLVSYVSVLAGFCGGSALNDMFRNSHLKQPCCTSSSKSVVGSNWKISFSCHYFHHCSQSTIVYDRLLALNTKDRMKV